MKDKENSREIQFKEELVRKAKEGRYESIFPVICRRLQGNV